MAKGLRGLVSLIALFGLSWIGVAQEPADPAGPCNVTSLRLRIATSNDDLRGGQDNLNIVVFFAAGQAQVAANVNKGQNWPNNSVNMVDIRLDRPVSPSEIRALRMIHISDGSFHVNLAELATLGAPIAIAQAFQSPDNWNMADVTVAAIGNGVGARIATHGYHRFTGSDPVLTIPVSIPANVCSSGRHEGNSGTRSNSGSGSGSAGGNPTTGPTGLPSTGTWGQPTVGAASGALTNQDVARMAKAGVPESSIVASIQGSPAAFDLSPEALIALKRAGAGESVLQAMVSHGHRELVPAVQVIGDGKSADELNPQPYPPHARTNAAGTVKPGELSAQAVPSKKTLLSPGGQQTMLATQANSPPRDGSKSALITAVQQPTITDGTRQAAATMSATDHPLGGDTGAIKSTGKARYEPITVDQGVTTDPEFNQWANARHEPIPVDRGVTTNPEFSQWANTTSQKTSGPSAPPQATTSAGSSVTGSATRNLNDGSKQGSARTIQPSQAILPVVPPSERQGPTAVAQYQPPGGMGRGANSAQMAPPTALDSASVGAACSQDPTPRILGVTGGGAPITFRPGHQYVIWGCSFGPANPNNAVYLSDGGSFQWFLSKSSWSSNAVSISFSVSPAGVQGFQKTYAGSQLGNLILFVLGQNGNAKLNGVVLSVQ